MLHMIIIFSKEFFRKIRVREEKGQGLIEYGLIVLLIAIVVIVALQALGVQITGDFQNISDTFGDDF